MANKPNPHVVQVLGLRVTPEGKQAKTRRSLGFRAGGLWFCLGARLQFRRVVDSWLTAYGLGWFGGWFWILGSRVTG